MSTSVMGTQNGETIVTVRNGSGDNYGTAFEIRNPDSSQIHVWGEAGDDTIEIAFNDITVFSKGHHVRGDQKRFSGGLFADTFVFTDLHEVSNGAVITGRIEDFDTSRDTLKIGSDEIDLFAGQGVAGGYAWKVVHYDSNPGDDAETEQPFLVIDTGDGFVFYAMEGARVTMDDTVGSEEVAQEDHFVKASNLPADPWALQVVAYVDPVNFVPAGYVAQGGVTINDYDDDPADVLAIIAGSADGDLIAAGINDDHVQALAGNDVVWGGSGHDTLDGGDGDDSLHGGTHDDSLMGGSGNDVLYGETGQDKLSGGDGFDVLYGDDGADSLYGGAQADNLHGGAGDDTLDGEHGNDRLFAGTGNDLGYGGVGDDALFGEGGDDTLYGGEGDDRFFGGVGNDLVMGGAGADSLYGGAGFDVLDGGDGDDILRGDFNWDVFVFADGHGQDTIEDFDALNLYERIDLSGLTTVGDYAILAGAMQQVGADVVIETGDGSSITLLDVALADLDANDFIL